VYPAPLSHGIVFERLDQLQQEDAKIIVASFNHVTQTQLSTTISNQQGDSVSTIEHLMAAFMGCGITNARIDIDGPEVPIMDGSSAPFVTVFHACGIDVQSDVMPVFTVTEKVCVPSDRGMDHGYVSYEPFDSRLFAINFDFGGRLSHTPHAGSVEFNLDDDDFGAYLAHCRTFGFLTDGQMLQAKGFAKGASLDNTVVLQADGTTMNELRYPNELVGHKMLDVLGDMALSNCTIVGKYTAHNPSHQLNNLLLRRLLQGASAV